MLTPNPFHSEDGLCFRSLNFRTLPIPRIIITLVLSMPWSDEVAEHMLGEVRIRAHFERQPGGRCALRAPVDRDHELPDLAREEGAVVLAFGQHHLGSPGCSSRWPDQDGSPHGRCVSAWITVCSSGKRPNSVEEPRRSRTCAAASIWNRYAAIWVCDWRKEVARGWNGDASYHQSPNSRRRLQPRPRLRPRAAPRTRSGAARDGFARPQR